MAFASIAHMKAFLAAIRFRLHARADSEHEQAIIRILIVAIVLIYLYLSHGPDGGGQPTIVWFLGLDVIFSALLFCHILVLPSTNRLRRAIGMVNDSAAATVVMFLTGEAGASMIGVYLFITFGNGFRYGRSYLFACQSLCLVGYTAVLLYDDHWQNHQTVGWSLMVALVVLPLYVSTLLKRIEQAKAKAEEANRAKSTFLANMSHEMRTPLNGIVGAIELFRATTLDGRQFELMRLLQHSVGMLRSLVDDVLDISKIEAGRLTIEIVDFDLHGTLNGLIGLLRPHARNKGLRLSALVDPAIDYELRGDPHHLTQVLLNLVSNAIKFTEQGSVEVSVRLKGETNDGVVLHFDVTDTGIGISEDAQRRIFDRFVQADDSTTRRYGGTGLGTTIAKQLVELMGGSIGVASTIGKGSTFWFEVPLLRSALGVIDNRRIPADTTAVVVADEQDQGRIRQMVVNVCTDVRVLSPREDVDAAISELYSMGRTISAVFFCGELERAHHLFSKLSRDTRNASAALIYVTSGSDYTTASRTLGQIEGVNLVAHDASPRYVRNAVHAATTKENSGQVIDLRAVLQEQRQPLRILVAEDNATNQQIIAQLLEEAGHQVAVAGDGEVALDLFEQHSPDLAILDFNMPERNGLEVTKAIRAMEPQGDRLPIMILSASVSAEARERARRAGADEFVGKPYDAAVLLQTIDRMARRARLTTRTDDDYRQRSASVQHISSTSASLIDINRLAELQRIAGNVDFLARLIESFNLDISRLTTTLTRLLEEDALTSIADVTHAIKGASVGIGATRLAACCDEVDNLAAAGQRDATSFAAARLCRCAEETYGELKARALVSVQKGASTMH
jgi:two-component system sensor histidine kinase RpfC